MTNFGSIDDGTPLPTLNEIEVTQSERDRHKGGHEKSAHMWPKLIASRYFSDIPEERISTEANLGDCKHDIIIESFDVNLARHTDTLWTPAGTVVEIVAFSDQDFLRKTKSALRHGYTIHWVFLDDCGYVSKARRELQPYSLAPLRFGQFNPWEPKFQLGTDIRFSNFEYMIHGIDESENEDEWGDMFKNEFEIPYVIGNGYTLAHGANGYNLGEIVVEGTKKRVFAQAGGAYFELRDASKLPKPREVNGDKSTKKKLKSLIKNCGVERVGPFAGYRLPRFNYVDPVTDPYCYPQKFERDYFHPHTVAREI